MRQRLRASAPAVALGLVVAGVTGYVLTFAYDASAFLNDEYGNVLLGRILAGDMGELFGEFQRGPERLTPFVLALPNLLLGSTPDEMRGGHLVLGLCYALAAVPAFALLRGLGVPRWAAVAVAAAAILGPWMVFGTTLLNITLAAPLTAAFVWAAWRAVSEPTLAREALAIVVFGLMTTARTSHGAFFGAVVVAAVAAAWWSRPAGERPWRLPLWLFRRTPLIAAVTALGLLVLVVVGTGDLVGPAYSEAAKRGASLSAIWSTTVWTAAVLTIGTGFIVVPIGAAWALRQAVRPADVRTGVFAVLALAMFVVYVYVTGTARALEQERYPAVLAVLPVVAFGAALFRREAWLIGTVGVGALTARAIATRGLEEDPNALNYFFAPGQLFFSRAIVQRASTVVPDEAVLTVVVVGLALVAVAVALLHARRPVAWIAVAGVLGLGLVSGVYTLRKNEPALVPADLGALAWLDRYARDGDAVFWNYRWAPNDAERGFRTRRTLYLNGSACCVEWPAEPEEFVRGDGTLDRDVDVIAGPTGYAPLAFAARDVARPEPYGPPPLRVQRFDDQRPRAVARVEGAGADGSVRTSARIVPLSDWDGHCVDVQLYGLEAATAGVGFALGDERGRLRPGDDRWVRIRGGDAVRRTGNGAPELFMGELRFVGCDEPLSR